MPRNCVTNRIAAVRFDAHVNAMTSSWLLGGQKDPCHVNNSLKVKTLRRNFKSEWVAPEVQNSAQLRPQYKSIS